MSERRPHIALYLNHLGGGGGERAIIYLARGFAEQGLNVDFVLSSTKSPHLWRIPDSVRIVDLQAKGLLSSLKALVGYLRREQPQTLLSALHYPNEVAIWAKYLSGVPTRVVVCEQNTLSRKAQNETKWTKRLTPWFVRWLYPWADGIVAVSGGVFDDLLQVTKLSPERLRIIYNPAVTNHITQQASEPVDHPWLAADAPPVILGVGKLEAQKDFPNLLRAFAQVRAQRPVRLIVLGWGPQKEALQNLAATLAVADDVDFPGYVDNPYAYMARSAAFVLSSAWEGLPFVLVEAMAVGTPVVSTDCPSGPQEILHGGEYGWLTPVGDSEALAAAIDKVLDGQVKTVPSQWLQQFTLENVVRQYLDVLGIDSPAAEADVCPKATERVARLNRKNT
ncbi:glycosyltransferase [Geitlerinema sp. PCC 9228]|uniref:glycosyltransferase n=1 Tax=Geitlerinema sp. PCC 9228 TaxID=111611 RepID=UPI0008F9D238|nr:glycosyltransferase [Geitlerinema sp. PCC 9228]